MVSIIPRPNHLQHCLDRCAAVALGLLLAVAAPACGSDAPQLTLHTGAGPVRVRVEIADTDESRRVGLMYRQTLADGDGMLFVFPSSQDHSFWMKNTFIPLDMIFIDEGRTIVGIHQRAIPHSRGQVSVGTPSRYVLEVPGGWATRRGATVGDRVTLPAGVEP